MTDERDARFAEVGGLYVSRRALFDQEIMRVRGHRFGQFVLGQHGCEGKDGCAPFETANSQNAGGKSRARYGVCYRR